MDNVSDLVGAFEEGDLQCLFDDKSPSLSLSSEMTMKRSADDENDFDLKVKSNLEHDDKGRNEIGMM